MRQKREFYLLNWKSVVNNVRVPRALSLAGGGGGGAETTSLAMRRVLHLWEETPVILSQKIWSYRRFEGD